MTKQEHHGASAEEENAAVEHVADLLAERFPEADREHIDELVEQEHESFDGAPVRDFVPVLVEHDVKEQLADEQLSAEQLSAEKPAAEKPAAD